MHINKISGVVVDTIYHVHRDLGPGLYETVYEEILCAELKQKGFRIVRQKPISLIWKEQILVEVAFKADFIVEDRLLLELKSVETLSPAHYKQVITYLRLTGLQVGLLINFNEALIKSGIHRIVNRLEE